MEHPEFLIQADGLEKRYGSVTALSNVDLAFSDNKIYGLFGRNGVGKTTFLDIITARIFADQGKVFCRGNDIVKHPQAVADICCYLPEKNFLPARYKVKKMLSYGKVFFPNFDMTTAQELCRRFDLNTEQKYGQLSSGYQSILRIVLTLAAKARISIFDEPVLGLDAAARDLFYRVLIEEFADHPRLFIISTHLIEESADLFNEIIIIKKGRVIRQASAEDLLANAFYVSGKTVLVEAFTQNRKVINCETVNGQKTVIVEGNMENEKRSPGLNFAPITIQNLFIYLTRE